MVLISCSTDRWVAHTEIAARFQKQDTRGYLWRYLGEGNAIVEPEGEVVVPSGDVMFSVEFVPVTKLRGKRVHKPVTPVTAEAWFLDRISGCIDVSDINVEVGVVRIGKQNGAPFSRPTAHVTGRGKVVDADLLRTLISKGIGDCKAYGFGLVIVEGIN